MTIVSFVAESPGISTVMAATDSDGAFTAVDIVINVSDIIPPSINVETSNGSFGFCLNQNLEVTAIAQGDYESINSWDWGELSDFITETTDILKLSTHH